MQIPKLKILIRHSVTEILDVKVQEISISWQRLSFYVLNSCLNPVANKAANFVCILKTKV